MKITVKSFAKINLFLEIIGKNNQNYHLLDSLMTFIDIYDVIEVERIAQPKSGKKDQHLLKQKLTPAGEVILEVAGSLDLKLLGNKEDNILIKTINLLAKKYDFTPNIKIKLEKNIPISAGLGGGSTNAATLIEILIKLYDLKISKEDLQEIALEIGSDVPFCLHKKMALISGIGEKVEDIFLDHHDLYLLIINPNKPLNTGKIFQNYQITKQKLKNNGAMQNQNHDLISLIRNKKNHLEVVAIKFCPEIKKILENLRLQRNIISAKLSGSGATCFGVFDKKSDLDLAFNNLKTIFPTFYIKKTKLLYSV
jgi:4-diphosphocytidyl-2-C-methyl-D-erythritol kinase